MADLIRRTPNQTGNINISVLPYPSGATTTSTNSTAYRYSSPILALEAQNATNAFNNGLVPTSSYGGGGRTSTGSNYATNPLVDYQAFRDEIGLDESFGIAGWAYGAMVRGQSQLPGGQETSVIVNGQTINVPSSRSGQSITSNLAGEDGGTSFSVQASIQWDLAQRQATVGTPEWARKILSDRSAPVPGSLDAAFQAAFPSVQAKREYFGEPAKTSYDRSIFGTRTSTTTLSPVESFYGQGTDGKMYNFTTDQEHVSGYGIPTMSEYSRLAPLGSALGAQGASFSPVYTTTSRGETDALQAAFYLAANPSLQALGYSSPAQGLANDVLNTYKLWGESAGAKAMKATTEAFYAPVQEYKAGSYNLSIPNITKSFGSYGSSTSIINQFQPSYSSTKYW